MNSANTLVFCDFDGTVARKDVGYHLFHHFSDGRSEELIPEWKAGLMSNREILMREAGMVRASSEEIYAFLNQFDLDPGFAPFAALCSEAGIDPVIVSEGMDFYIHYVLRRNRLPHLKILSNIGHLENGRIRIEFPYANHSCRRCGNCKGERMAEYRSRAANGCKVVFIGDGFSDLCAARETDILYAKKDLEDYCLRENLRYNKYCDFFDVAAHMRELGLLTR